MNPLAQMIREAREPEPTLIDLSGDVETQCRHLGYFRDAALVLAQESASDGSLDPDIRDLLTEFYLSEARLYAFEIETARQATGRH